MSNQELFDEACQYIPGGVNSPVRAFQSVESAPVFVKSAKGSRVLVKKIMNILIIFVHGDP